MKKAKIINTGRNLGKPGKLEQISFMANQRNIILPKIKQQSRRDKTIIYGGEAVNALLPKSMNRPTSDFDIMSPMQRKHALEMEHFIDKTTHRDMVHIKQLPHPLGRGKQLFRIEVRNTDVTLVDYNPMKKTSVVIKRGVRYESLSVAERKYHRMIKTGDRFVKPTTDLARIEENRLLKKWRKHR